MMRNSKEPNSKDPIVIANWKMNLLLKETEELINNLRDALEKYNKKTRVVICPSYVYLFKAQKLLAHSEIGLGAQDVFWEIEGNYTSKISVSMLKELGCQYVIIGHSERKKYAYETDETIDRKTVTAVRNGLLPIVCVGETREQRRERVQDLVVTDQVKKALRYVNPLFSHEKLIIAYEPVWSIYPGQPCEPSQAREIALVIKQALIDLYPTKVVENNFRIIYGGSVDEKNVKDYVDGEHIEGVLVGSASLKSSKFINIIKSIS